MIMNNKPLLVVIGGGFGGIELIKKLKNKPFDIILVDWIWNYFTYEYSFRIITQPFRKEKCRECEE